MPKFDAMASLEAILVDELTHLSHTFSSFILISYNSAQQNTKFINVANLCIFKPKNMVHRMKELNNLKHELPTPFIRNKFTNEPVLFEIQEGA